MVNEIILVWNSYKKAPSENRKGLVKNLCFLESCYTIHSGVFQNVFLFWVNT